jgi:hypothetical protein
VKILNFSLAAAVAWVAAATAPVNAAEPVPPAQPTIQISGRVIHTWYEKEGLRVILVIDGFTVLTHGEQLTARDGVVWFDEAAAQKTGRAELGVFAETGAELRRTGGEVEKYDSAYLVMADGAEISLVAEEGQLRGKADSTPLYLRAKKRRREFLEAGVRETPAAVIKPPEVPPPIPAPGIREAAVPQEISIVPQDDVRQVNFSSFVEDDVRISIWTGGVYVMRGDMEMAADNLVIWTPEEAVRRAGGAAEEPVGRQKRDNQREKYPAGGKGPAALDRLEDLEVGLGEFLQEVAETINRAEGAAARLGGPPQSIVVRQKRRHFEILLEDHELGLGSGGDFGFRISHASRRRGDFGLNGGRHGRRGDFGAEVPGSWRVGLEFGLPFAFADGREH